MPEVSDFLHSLGRGVRTSSDLQEMLGVSQSTVSRLIAEAGEAVLRLGARRSTRYAAARKVFGENFAIPVYEIDAQGRAQALATLRQFSDGRFFVQGDDLPRWLRGNDDDGVFPGLPYFLDDLRPSGFLGRLFARRVAEPWGFPEDSREWNEEQLGLCLLRAGDLLPGNIVIGEGAAGRAGVWQGERVVDPETEYPRLAASVLAGDMPGSSAGGEQPKFSAWREQVGHVLVKFSADGNNPEARRWRDLLLAEHHAQEALRVHGFPSAESTVFHSGGRIFLESRRFDRTDAYGRRPMISLAAIDAEFAGTGRDWQKSATALRDRGLIDSPTLERICALQQFGTQIGNTDMHLGNLSLAPYGDAFTLLPVYDMLPMALAPRFGSIPHALPSRPPSEGLPDVVLTTLDDYRKRVHRDERISSAFRRIS